MENTKEIGTCMSFPCKLDQDKNGKYLETCDTNTNLRE